MSVSSKLDSKSDTSSTISDSLNWYKIWGLSTTAKASQHNSCEGSIQDQIFFLKCDPLNVSIFGEFTSSSECRILFMRKHHNSDSVKAEFPTSKAHEIHTQRCFGYISKKNISSFHVNNPERIIDNRLSNVAKDIASKYLVGSQDGCTFHFPKISKSDPFFHVYEQCNNQLEAIYEFTIQSGQIELFPHWTYRKNQIPQAVTKRLLNKSLWLAD